HETAGSAGGQNRAGGRPIPIHPPGSPSPPPAIPDKLLIAISESRRPLRKSVHHPGSAGLMQVDQLVSNNCPINVYRQRWTSSRGSPHIHALWAAAASP